MTIASIESNSDRDTLKVVRHVPVKKLKLVVSAYRSVGAKVSSKPEHDTKNEYIVTAQFS